MANPDNINGSSARCANISKGIFAGILILFLCLASVPLLTNSATVDEVTDIPTGYSQAWYGLYYLDSANPPFIRQIDGLLAGIYDPQLYWGPGLSQIDFGSYSYYFAVVNAQRYHSIVICCRLAILLMTLLTGFLIYRWAKEEYGEWAGLGCMGIFLLNPLVLAHGTLATLDMGLTLTWVASLYALYKYCKNPSWLLALFTGLFLGMAICSKFTTILLLPVIPAGIILIPEIRKKLAEDWQKTLFHLAGALVIFLLAVNLIYRFEGSFSPASHYQFNSNLFKSLFSFLPGWLPLPFPEDFIKGFESQFSNLGKYTSYLNGNYSDKGFYLYYLEAFLIKNPIPFLIMLGWAGYLRAKDKKKLSFTELLSILVVLVVFLVFSLSRAKNIGVRYLLPAYPFIILLLGGLFTQKPFQRKNSYLLGGLFTWQIVSMIWVCPHYIPYFNEAVGGPAQGHRYLVDSNLDWGQDFIRLKQYMDKNKLDRIMFKPSGILPPMVYGINAVGVPETPAPGIIAMSVNHYYGIFYTTPEGRAKYNWLKNYKPIDKIGYSIWIYKITPEEIQAKETGGRK
jgi:4-amino-4-deoxy-L-arabinose transferase-like glycosyltransferase